MNQLYTSPFSDRYASQEMLKIFSAQKKHSTWRRLWISLAKAEQELGLSIRDDQIQELIDHVDQIDFTLAAEYEEELQHDVMAHIHTYGDQCPKARAIIHLGATSCYVTDNTEVIQVREALHLLQTKVQQVIAQLSRFAHTYAKTPCLGFTHFQPAQLTTVGKRACLWIQDFLLDLQEIEYRLSRIRFLGVKGATGTQASFLSLFHGDHEKVKALDTRVAELMGFDAVYPISGQTYTRKQDQQVIHALSGLATSAHKFATDLRLLANMKELEEPFGKNQVGSSAMPYKRNPMLSERICSIGRFVISLSENPSYTAATQWLERTLDDSANRRLCISQAFLGCDSILDLLIRVTDGIVVNEKMIEKHIQEELPFMATENILMFCVEKGGDRQELHEKIRVHSMEAGKRVKEGGNNDLLDRIANDTSFNLSPDDLSKIVDIYAFVGRAPEQTKDFINHVMGVEPVGGKQ